MCRNAWQFSKHPVNTIPIGLISGACRVSAIPSPIDQDFVIPELDKLLLRPSVELSRLVWQTMCSLPRYSNVLQATYRKNEANGSRYADSQLVHLLRNTAWVPQSNETFVRPSEASRILLPKGFPFDEGYEWLGKVRFGEKNWKVVEESQTKEAAAKKMGFPDAGSLERAKQFATLPQSEQNGYWLNGNGGSPRSCQSMNPMILSGVRSTSASKQPMRQSGSPRIAHALCPSAGTMSKSKRNRTYGNNIRITDGEMICQVCKTPLPFKLDDGSWFFEKVEFLPELTKRHYQNYLALCPNHAAMFQHANGSEDSMQLMFLELEGNELEVVLAQQDMTIYFTKTHIADLKVVIEAEDRYKAMPLNNRLTASAVEYELHSGRGAA